MTIINPNSSLSVNSSSFTQPIPPRQKKSCSKILKAAFCVFALVAVNGIISPLTNFFWQSNGKPLITPSLFNYTLSHNPLITSTASALVEINVNLSDYLSSVQIIQTSKSKLPELEGVKRAQQEQLLRYASPVDIEEIKKCYNHPKMEEVVSLLNDGFWDEFLARFSSSGNELSYLLLASYTKEKISIETLATAMFFHLIHYYFPSDMKIVPISNDREGWLQLNDSVEPNQRVMIILDGKALDYYTENTIKSLLGTSGVFFLKTKEKKIFYGVPSCGLLSEFYKRKYGHILTYILGLTPTREEVIKTTLLGESHVSLFKANSLPLIHGTRHPFFLVPHDLFHAESRAKLTQFPGLISDAMTLATKIQNYLELGHSDYKKKLTKPCGFVVQLFGIPPTEEDLVNYFLRHFSGGLLDGSYQTTRLLDINPFKSVDSDKMYIVDDSLSLYSISRKLLRAHGLEKLQFSFDHNVWKIVLQKVKEFHHTRELVQCEKYEDSLLYLSLKMQYQDSKDRSIFYDNTTQYALC